MNPAADLAVIYDWQSASENQWTKPPAGWQGVYGNGELPEELGAEGAFGRGWGILTAFSGCCRS